MGNTTVGRIKIFCNSHNITTEFYYLQISLGLKWCYKCKDWKHKDNFSLDKSRYDKKKAKCINCARVKQKKSRKGMISTFKGKKHTQASIMILRSINKGNGNPNWKGGITTLLIQIRNTQKYKDWRRNVYHNGNFTCLKCGTKKIGNNIILDADHIIPLAKIVYDNGIKSVDDAIKCDAIFDCSNGRCLCRNCHKETQTWGVNINK